MLLNQLVPAPIKLMEIHSRDARHILAARSWCILRTAGHDPMPRLMWYLQYETVATRFGLLMETVTQIWPDPFASHRPCCPTASIDESLLVEAVQLAALDARPAFDMLFQDMLPSEARNLFFTRARLLYEV